MELVQAAVLFGAGAIAGGINSIAGGGSLVSFPALVWTGIDPVVANATNTLSISPGALSSMVAYRRELAGVRNWILFLTAPSVVGGLLGALLLLRTPAGVFADVVPYLILFATAVFALQESIGRAAGPARSSATREAPAFGASARLLVSGFLFQLAVSIYGGYFGAGIGIMMLACLGLLGFTNLHQMSGMRNFFGFCINAIAALYFVRQGCVDWPAAAVMTLGQVAGGYGGARVARRLDRVAVRRIVVAIGIAMTASLLLRR